MEGVIGLVSVFGGKLGSEEWQLTQMRSEIFLIIPHTQPAIDQDYVEAVVKVPVSGNIAFVQSVDLYACVT